MPKRLRAPFGRPFGLPLCPGLNGFRFLSFFSVPAVTDLPRVLAISPSEFILCSRHKIAKLSHGSIPFFPTTRFKEVRMKWLLLLTILSGYSGSSTEYTALGHSLLGRWHLRRMHRSPSVRVVPDRLQNARR